MKTRDELIETIQSVHVALNQLYAIDSGWRTRGGWASDVNGSILHPGATSAQIAEGEGQFGQEFPPSYRNFLQLHNGWEHFWADVTLVGVLTKETRRAQEKIAEYIEYQRTEGLGDVLSDFLPPTVAAWEAEHPRHLYLANHLVIGANFRGALWAYDTRTRRPDGEMTLVHWDISYGAQDPTFASFDEFLDWAAYVATARVEQLKNMQKDKTGGKPKKAGRKQASGSKTKRPKKGKA